MTAKWQPPALQTNHLTLRSLAETDAPAIFEYASQPKVSRSTLWEPQQTVPEQALSSYQYLT